MVDGSQSFKYFNITPNVVAMIPSTPIKEVIEAIETVPTTCFALPNELIFVDCGAVPELIVQFRKDMEEKFQRKTSYLIFTHTHWDHILSMEVFSDVNVVSSDLGIQEISNYITLIKNNTPEECQTAFDVGPKLGEIIAKSKFFIPNIVVNDEYKFESDGIKLVCKKIGGHSPSSMYVYFPSEKVLCAGDNLIECYAQVPGNPDDTLRILNVFKTLDIETIIPGHGRLVNPQYLDHVIQYFNSLKSYLKKAINEKLKIKDILNRSDLPEYFGKEQKCWIEGLKPDSNWIDNTIRSWYRYIKRSSRE